ncbi:MAG: DUF3305 domain-containing protein [Pseudomonadota bacterium]
MRTTAKTTALKVGVVLAREDIDHPWQDHRWRPLSVLVGIPALNPGDVLKRGDGFTHYFAGTFEIEMHRKETSAYVVNLENDVPVVYVVATDAEDEDAGLPYDIRLVTVSPFEAQDYLDSGEDIVEAIPMIEPLIAWVERFIEEHHEEEVFIKRQRDKVRLEIEKFGQEPIALTRQRQRRKFDA